MNQGTADENLATIRSLIERAEIYRAIFARAALIGGILSILTAGAVYLNDEVTHFLNRTVRPREFAFAWVDVFVLTLIVAGLFWWWSARGRNEAAASARLKFAFRTVAPCLVIPAAFTSWFFTTGYLGAAELELVVVWIVFYGLMLLSTAFFAPPAIALLGWAFLLTGLSVPLCVEAVDNWLGNVSTVFMGTTFGLYHLIFAALNWRRRVPVAGKIEME